MTVRVLVLGCGPAGLIAAHAATEAGAQVTIISNRKKSVMRGAQYLHEMIPGVPASEFEVEYLLTGDAEVYRKKVYADLDGIEVSVDSLVGTHPAWDIRETYDHLWNLYGHDVREWEATTIAFEDVERLLKPALTISTIPARVLCKDPHHKFESVRIWATETAPDIPFWSDNKVVCSGESRHGWYRQSRIQGFENSEFALPPTGLYASHEKAWPVEKPIRTNCDCYPRVERMGRYGRWEKGVLSHTAYSETWKLMEGLWEAYTI